VFAHLAPTMNTDMSVFAKTSAFGIKSLETLTIDFNGNRGNNMKSHLLKILMETSDKDDIHKFFNTELKKTLREADDHIGTIYKILLD